MYTYANVCFNGGEQNFGDWKLKVDCDLKFSLKKLKNLVINVICEDLRWIRT